MNFQQRLNLVHGLHRLDFSTRTAGALYNARIKTVMQLARMTERDLLKVKNLGTASIREIRSVLAQLDLDIGMDLPEELDVEVSSITGEIQVCPAGNEYATVVEARGRYDYDIFRGFLPPSLKKAERGEVHLEVTIVSWSDR